MVKDTTEEELITTRHGNDCPILCGTRINKIRAIIQENDNEDKLCWYCNGEKLNYDKFCEAWCCKHYEFVVDFRTGLIHKLDCRTIKKMPIYDAMFKPMHYNLIDGYKKLKYSSLCLFCLNSVVRLN